MRSASRRGSVNRRARIWADPEPTGDAFEGKRAADGGKKNQIKFKPRPGFAAQTGNCAAS